MRAIQDLTLEDSEILHEDLEDLTKRRDIKESIDRGQQDSSERRSVHISVDWPLRLLENNLATFVQQ